LGGKRGITFNAATVSQYGTPRDPHKPYRPRIYCMIVRRGGVHSTTSKTGHIARQWYIKALYPHPSKVRPSLQSATVGRFRVDSNGVHRGTISYDQQCRR
jgi:hypothetical protein